MALKFFISHASEDIEKIQPLLDLIKSQGNIDMFLAEHSISPGENFEKRILREIESSDLLILFYSKNAEKSHYVINEIGAAKGKEIDIIPILLDDTKPKGMLSYVNYVDLSNPDNYQSEKKRLEEFLQKKLRKNAIKNAIIIGGVLLLFIAYLDQ